MILLMVLFNLFIFNFYLCFHAILVKVALVIIQNVNSMPQFFGQSFASSSFTDSSGKVSSKSVYTDTTGKQLIDAVPQIVNDLLPPLLPNQIPGIEFPNSSQLKKVPVLALEVEPPPLPETSTYKPTVFETAATITTTRTTTTTSAPVQRPQTTTTKKFQQQSAKQSVDHNNVISGNEIKHFDGSYRSKGNDGTYRPKGNLGIYIHNNAGAYKHDDRGKYRRT